MKVGRIEKITISALLILTLFSAVALTLPGVRAEGTVDTVEITVPVACSMTGTVSTAHTKSILNAHLEENIGTTNAKVVCNDNSGYAVYAIGYTDDEYGKTVLADSTLDSTNDIVTGLATTGNTSNWAMKLTKAGSSYYPIIAGSTDDTTRQTGDPDFSDYAVVPNEYTKVLYYPSSTDVGTGALGSNFTTTYRAYISRTQHAGTYVGQVKYTLVHPSTEAAPMAPLSPNVAPNNTIVYAPNTSDTLGDMSSLGTTTALSTASPTAGMQIQAVGSCISSCADIASGTTEVELIAPNFYREGYGFAGWSTDFVATSTSTIYGPNETISTNPTNGGLDVSSGAILYPVWVASTGNLQGWNNCNSLTTAPTNARATLSSITALTDTRDGNVYTIARLADGKCWMIENLRLDNTATISTSDTHNPLHDVNNNVTLKIDYANNTIASHLASTNDSWCTSNNASCDDQTMLNTNNTNFGGKNTANTNLTASYNSSNNNSSQWYSYGNYYNWYSATAGNGTYSFSTNNDSVTGDLCPTGWRLPKGGKTTVNTTADYYVLIKTLMSGTEPNKNNTNGYGYYSGTVGGVDLGATASKSLRAYPNNFVYSGSWSGAQALNRSRLGYYWSSSAYNSYRAYYPYLDSSDVYPGTSDGNKRTGLAVRCVAGS